MSKNAYILEAFKQFNSLVEEEELITHEELPIYDVGSEKMHTFLDFAGDDSDEPINITDLEAEAEEDLKQSYVGKIILDCNVCHSNIFIDRDEITINEEGIANMELECPYCMSNEGYTLIGQVEPYSEYVEEEGVVIEDEPEIDDEDEIIEEGMKLDGVDELKGTKGLRRRKEKDGHKAIRGRGNTELSGTEDLKESHINECGDQDVILDECGDFDSEETNEGLITKEERNQEVADLGSDYNKGIIGDNEFDQTMDSIDQELKEDIQDVTITTDDETMTMSTKEDGGVAVETTPLDEIEDEPFDEGGVEIESDEIASDDEVIGPIDDEDESKIELNSELASLEDDDIDELEDEDEIFDVDEFDEESFDELGESYLREQYDNVDGFRTINAKIFNNSLIVEGVIRFNSGASKGTSFVFEAVNAKNNNVLFEGYNSQISRGKKTFKLNCNLKEGVIKPYKMRYNYTAKNELNESVRVNGTVKVKH